MTRLIRHSLLNLAPRCADPSNWHQSGSKRLPLAWLVLCPAPSMVCTNWERTPRGTKHCCRNSRTSCLLLARCASCNAGSNCSPLWSWRCYCLRSQHQFWFGRHQIVPTACPWCTCVAGQRGGGSCNYYYYYYDYYYFALLLPIPLLSLFSRRKALLLSIVHCGQ